MRRIITVGREFGSGGREIGRRIAEELQIAYYDQEIITEIAKRTALSEAYIRQIEEKRPVVSFPIHIGHSFYLSPDPTFHPDLSIYTKQHDLLHELARKSDCVIVGRCANAILKERPCTFNVFIHAPLVPRIGRVMKRENIDHMEAAATIERIDAERAEHCKHFTGTTWGDADAYVRTKRRKRHNHRQPGSRRFSRSTAFTLPGKTKREELAKRISSAHGQRDGKMGPVPIFPFCFSACRRLFVYHLDHTT